MTSRRDEHRRPPLYAERRRNSNNKRGKPDDADDETGIHPWPVSSLSSSSLPLVHALNPEAATAGEHDVRTDSSAGRSDSKTNSWQMQNLRLDEGEYSTAAKATEMECTMAVEESTVWGRILPRAAANSPEHAAPVAAAAAADFADTTAEAAASDDFQWGGDGW